MNHTFKIAQRILLFAVGLFMMGLGIAMSTRPQLGTSPITSLPYVTTMFIPWTLGVATIVVNVLFLLAQAAILKSRFRLSYLIQLPMLFLFGFFIDLGMWMTAFWTPEMYLLRLLENIVGCAFIAVGIFLQLRADITMMPGDSLIRVISEEFRFPFGTVKICFDCSIVLSAIVFSLCFLRTVAGVREGTVLAAILVGTFIKALNAIHTRIARKGKHGEIQDN